MAGFGSYDRVPDVSTMRTVTETGAAWSAAGPGAGGSSRVRSLAPPSDATPDAADRADGDDGDPPPAQLAAAMAQASTNVDPNRILRVIMNISKCYSSRDHTSSKIRST